MNGGDFEHDGFALIAQVLTPAQCKDAALRVRFDGAGTRCLLAQPWCAAMAAQLQAHPALAAIIGPHLLPVQCTYFEKSADRNWLVPLHQDLSIPVAGRVDDPSLSGWSIKEGTQFVRAPLVVLSQLVAVRVHLDVCALEDGPLRVVAASHLRGVIGDDEAGAIRRECGETVCVAAVGDALALRPLLLHASSKGSGNSLRRVLHFVFGPLKLPHGLRWSEQA